jgi:hypothetical protein
VEAVVLEQLLRFHLAEMGLMVVGQEQVVEQLQLEA